MVYFILLRLCVSLCSLPSLLTRCPLTSSLVCPFADCEEKISEYVLNMRSTTSILLLCIFGHHRSSETTQVVDVSRLLRAPDIVGTLCSSGYTDNTLTKTTKHVLIVVHFYIVIIIITWVRCDAGQSKPSSGLQQL